MNIESRLTIQLNPMLKKIKKYFQYEDKLRRTVSIVTGILIIIYSVFSGIMIIHIISVLLFGVHKPGLLIFLIYTLPGILVGGIILWLSLKIIDRIQRGIVIEEYSYLRLVLFATVIMYLLILIIYSIVSVTIFVKGKLF